MENRNLDCQCVQTSLQASVGFSKCMLRSVGTGRYVSSCVTTIEVAMGPTRLGGGGPCIGLTLSDLCKMQLVGVLMVSTYHTTLQMLHRIRCVHSRFEYFAFSAILDKSL